MCAESEFWSHDIKGFHLRPNILFWREEIDHMWKFCFQLKTNIQNYFLESRYILYSSKLPEFLVKHLEAKHLPSKCLKK